MTRAEDVWSKAALEALSGVPLAERDQIEALVGEICRDPFGLGADDPAQPDPLGRARVAVSRRAVVFYEVVDEDIVRVVRIFWRS